MSFLDDFLMLFQGLETLSIDTGTEPLVKIASVVRQDRTLKSLSLNASGPDRVPRREDQIDAWTSHYSVADLEHILESCTSLEQLALGFPILCWEEFAGTTQCFYSTARLNLN